jgi:flagellar motor switch protein FliN
MSFTHQEWVDRFVSNLVTVVAALTDATPATRPSADPPREGWVVRLEAEKGARGSLAAEFDEAGAETLTKRIVGLEIDPPAEMVIDTLKELCAQAAGSMVMEPPLVQVKLAVASVNRADGAAPPAAVLTHLAIENVLDLPLRLWGDIELAAADADPIPQVRPPAAPVNPKLDVILDIDLPLTVCFGRTELPLREVAGLGPGSVIDLGRSPDDVVEVLVGNQVVARGEVVIVEGNYGVRITDVMSPADRVRSMEGEI